MPRGPPESMLPSMIRASDEYWDFDRASYEDELDAWRERTAAPMAPMAVAVAPRRHSVARYARRQAPVSTQNFAPGTLAALRPTRGPLSARSRARSTLRRRALAAA